MKQTLSLVSVAVFSFLFCSAFVSAHSVVSPAQTGVSKYETFSLGVPNEKDVPTTAVKLLIPEGVSNVMPYVKPGWTISVTKEGDVVTALSWTGGVIPVGQKDVFLFSARTAPESTTLVWKAYQTYQGGTIVAWDRTPTSGTGGEKVANPYSTTEVIADTPGDARQEGYPNAPLLSIVAIALSLFALVISWQKK